MDAAENKTPSSELASPVSDTNGNPAQADIEKLAAQFKGFDFFANNKRLFGSNDSSIPVSFPAEVERRILALKNLQVEMFNTDCKFFEELHALETKYVALQNKNCAKRSEIITGKYEPSKEESNFKVIGEEEDVERKDEKTDVENEKNNGDSPAPVSGIPMFWLTIFRNVDHFADLVETCDLPILEHLQDIQTELTNEPVGFKLLFHFAPNDYFTNSVLDKTYQMRILVDPKDPLSFEGPEIYKSSGCKIDWKEGMDVTTREVKKKQKHKSTGAIRMTSKLELNPSFFNFFNPPQISDDVEDIDPDIQDKVTIDFELGSFLKERIVPRAVLYFTGEALESDDEDDEFSDETEDSETDPDSGNERNDDDSVAENDGEEEEK